jgi:hypothetical protein
MEYRAPPGVALILSNPPFKIAAEVVEHALALCPRVVTLLRTLFLESQGRCELLRRHCTRVHVFADRIPDMHRDGWTGPLADTRQNLSWFVLQRDASPGFAKVDWIWAQPTKARRGGQRQ